MAGVAPAVAVSLLEGSGGVALLCAALAAAYVVCALYVGITPSRNLREWAAAVPVALTMVAMFPDPITVGIVLLPALVLWAVVVMSVHERAGPAGAKLVGMGVAGLIIGNLILTGATRSR